MPKLPTSCTEVTENHVHEQTRGWMIPYLLGLDGYPVIGTGRWGYWLEICDRLTLPEEPIPQVEFICPGEIDNYRSPYPDLLPEHPVKHVKRILDVYVYKGYWYDDAWLTFVRWLLHGFGRRDLEDEVDRIPKDVHNFWYTQFNLAYLLALPVDWSAYILQGGPRWMGRGRAKWAKGTGFFATPMNICTMMTRMESMTEDRDTRLLTVCDPCCGTGSMLLSASNYSLRLCGTDIVHDLCLCAELNGWLYAPWLVYTTTEVKRMFGRLTGETTPSLPPIHHETDPDRVEMVQAYRAGELTQVDFFTTLGLDS